MGKLGPRLDSRKNAKRWPKGQSSSCNPETTKHRDQAAWFLKGPIASGKPGITTSDLEKHDAIQGIEPQFEKLDLEENRSETSTENTVDTFATNYSNCSNVSFSRFLSHFQSNSLLHKEMLAVLSAVTEIIKQHGGSESSVEYFAALMSTLEAIEDDTSIAATLSLLGMGLKTVPKNILNAQFGAASKIFLDILAKYATSEDYLILRHCIHCLSLLLRAQELAAWSNASTMQVLDAVLSFITHSKPRVRKSAQHGICAILKGSDIMKAESHPQYHPTSPHIGKYCITQLQLSSEPGGVTSILHVLTLLKDILHHLPKAHVKTISECLLKLMTLKNVLITSCCLQTFHGLFVSRPSENVLPGQRNAQIITALYDYQPPATDTQPTLAWLAVMQEAHLNLAQISLNLCAAILPKMFDKCMELWLSDRSDVISGTSHTIKILLQDCIGKMCEDESITKYKTTIDQTTCTMHKALSYQYLEAWYHILHLIAVLFQVTGKSKSPHLVNILRTLADLRDSYNFASKNDAEYAIGAAIRVLGPEEVLNIIPLKISEDMINLKRTWLLPLLKDCVVKGSLTFFSETLLPIAELCEKKSKEPIGGKTYEFLVSQIWAVLPSICTNATDVKDNFKNIARLLGTSFSEKKSLRPSIMAALRRLIVKAVDENKLEDTFELARFAKNFLPLFLNLYTTRPIGTDEEGQRLAAFETIKVYLTITSKDLVHELFDRAICRLNEPNADEFFKESVHDIIRLLIEYTDVDRLKTFYDMCILSLKDSSKIKEQKKAYRFLEEICGSEKDVCKSFIVVHRREIQKLLISSATEVAKPSRGPRLRCLINLIKSHPQLEKMKFLEAIVPEVVIYIKDINSKCRASAYQLLNTIAERFLENPEQLKEYVNMLIIGLAGAQKYCTASMLALASVTYHYNGSLGVEKIKEIFEHACKLVASPTREIAEAALSYAKVYITVMPSPIVASTLTKLIDSLSTMDGDCHRHFRQKIRDILAKLLRKYGMETISAMVPGSNTVLHKRLKNISKLEEAKKKKRELRRSKEQESDEDSEFNAKRRPKTIEEILADSEDEFEDTDNESQRKNKKRTSRKEAWIQENEEIVDLIDPAAARNITTTHPGSLNTKAGVPKPKDRGFKTAPDGRLIILDDNDIDDETEVKKKKKSPLLLHSDSEDDYDIDDNATVATMHSTQNKRKRNDTVDNVSLRSESTSRYQAGGSGIHRPLKKGKIVHTPGSEFKAPKAGGDVKKKGKPDPYAYVPLSRAALNKRKKKKNASKFQGIIKGAKKGARIGMKNKNNYI
ncbi:RRP12-like protein isoform X2 [Ceratina calcarata]|uniref:RRP12-like protein isoform X2 n=1 Tax=Ceratina calcarata TaxID=156304 RepID=A0AAJ7W9X1_9HYME|nr:RRP12-like protein isoform X2 [Ceratina calcarata]